MYVDSKLYAAEELANAIIIRQAADSGITVQENLRIFAEVSACRKSSAKAGLFGLDMV